MNSIPRIFLICSMLSASAVLLGACSKEGEPAAEQGASAALAAPVSVQQQTAIDALDKPIMHDEVHDASEASTAHQSH